MSSLKQINERIDAEFDEAVNLNKLFSRNSLAEALKLLEGHIEENYSCDNLGSNPPEWTDCQCNICEEMPHILALIVEAKEIAKDAEI